jgi:hypothetical protein
MTHSAAERCRRERLNKALQTLADLLTANLGEEALREINQGRAGASHTATKATIVEMAIEYISAQQKLVRQMKTKLEECQLLASNI